MNMPEDFPGGDRLNSVSLLGPQTLREILSTHETLSERTVAHTHAMARALLGGVTTIPGLEDCRMRVFRRPSPSPMRELGGGLGFYFSEPCPPVEGLPPLGAIGIVAKVYVYRVLGDSGAGRIYELDGFTSDEADEVARTSGRLATMYQMHYLPVGPDLISLAGEQPEQLTIDAVDFDLQRL